MEKQQASSVKIKLPTQRTAPLTAIEDFTVLIYGSSGIGKSTWCSKSDGALFFATEPGLNALDVFQIPITNWIELCQAGAEVAKGGHQFRTVIIDTADNAYQMCAKWVCEQHNVKHQSDLEYGKGWALVNNEFTRFLIKMGSLPYGLYLVSHSVEKDIDTRTGKKVHSRPTLPDKMREILLGMVDIILFCDIEDPEEGSKEKEPHRVIRTQPHTMYEAKDRTGFLPETLPLDYAAFKAAFLKASGAAVKAKGTRR